MIRITNRFFFYGFFRVRRARRSGRFSPRAGRTLLLTRVHRCHRRRCTYGYEIRATTRYFARTENATVRSVIFRFSDETSSSFQDFTGYSIQLPQQSLASICLYLKLVLLHHLLPSFVTLSFHNCLGRPLGLPVSGFRPVTNHIGSSDHHTCPAHRSLLLLRISINFEFESFSGRRTTDTCKRFVPRESRDNVV